MGRRLQIALLAISVLMAAPVFAQQPQDTAAKPADKSQAAAADAQNSAAPANAESNYVIGAQDVLDINVWKEPDVSRSVPVRPDGKISLPLINDIQAAGLTPLQLASQIATGLTKYINNPQVTVIVSQINSQRVYILGQVNRPGAFQLLPDMTVLQAISNAGGFTLFANTKKIYIIRQDHGKQQKLYFDYKSVVSGRQPEQNIILRPGDTLYVP